jgi:hypothetical protein
VHDIVENKLVKTVQRGKNQANTKELRLSRDE